MKPIPVSPTEILVTSEPSLTTTPARSQPTMAPGPVKPKKRCFQSVGLIAVASTLTRISFGLMEGTRTSLMMRESVPVTAAICCDGIDLF